MGVPCRKAARHNDQKPLVSVGVVMHGCQHSVIDRAVDTYRAFGGWTESKSNTWCVCWQRPRRLVYMHCQDSSLGLT